MNEKDEKKLLELDQYLFDLAIKQGYIYFYWHPELIISKIDLTEERFNK